jgi:hypothetical protein
MISARIGKTYGNIYNDRSTLYERRVVIVARRRPTNGRVGFARDAVSIR